MNDKRIIENIMKHASWMTARDPYLASNVASFFPKSERLHLMENKKLSPTFEYDAFELMKRNSRAFLEAPPFQHVWDPDPEDKEITYFWKPNDSRIEYVVENSWSEKKFSHVFDKDQFYQVTIIEEKSGDSVRRALIIQGSEGANMRGKALFSGANGNIWSLGNPPSSKDLLLKLNIYSPENSFAGSAQEGDALIVGEFEESGYGFGDLSEVYIDVQPNIIRRQRSRRRHRRRSRRRRSKRMSRRRKSRRKSRRSKSRRSRSKSRRRSNWKTHC